MRGRIKGSKSERKLNKGREKDWKREREREREKEREREREEWGMLEKAMLEEGICSPVEPPGRHLGSSPRAAERGVSVDMWSCDQGKSGFSGKVQPAWRMMTLAA